MMHRDMLQGAMSLPEMHWNTMAAFASERQFDWWSPYLEKL